MWMVQRRLLNDKGQPMATDLKRTAGVETLYMDETDVLAFFTRVWERSAWIFFENKEVEGPWNRHPELARP